jgi:hypothetical protein
MTIRHAAVACRRPLSGFWLARPGEVIRASLPGYPPNPEHVFPACTGASGGSPAELIPPRFRPGRRVEALFPRLRLPAARSVPPPREEQD